MEEPVKLDVIEGIARVTMNRAKVFNAFNLDSIRFLAETLIELAMDRRI
jgi:enoyl-CoA hydratase/carnithine racemase